MAESYQHLNITRTEPVNDRRPRQGFGSARIPADAPEFARNLQSSLRLAVERAARESEGIDDRYLLKIETEDGFAPSQLAHISGQIEIISHEQRGVILAFATAAALDEFEKKLSSIIAGEKVTYPNVVFALDEISNWTAVDRTGWSLKQFVPGNPAEMFAVDIELFPSDAETSRNRIVENFESFCKSIDVEVIDRCVDPNLVLYRVGVDSKKLDVILNYRDVRKADLPPAYSLPSGGLTLDIQDLPPIPAPPKDAVAVAVLDTGIESGHPLLRSAVGDAQVFCSSPPGLLPEDDHGHGTQVAGVALYGDVARCADAKVFVPTIWILSGRVLDSRGEYYSPTAHCLSKTSLIENDVAKAVEYFQEHYQCKIFNLSFGDPRRPFGGGRLEGLATKLDALARDRDVLFVVCTGNRKLTAPPLPYAKGLLSEDGRLLDPAPALNAITVGGIARYDKSRASIRYPSFITDQPIARHNQPAPMTRVGPTAGGAIKPDFVAYAGNWAVDSSSGTVTERGLGELTTGLTGNSFTGLLEEVYGTSYASPFVANLAARILTSLPEASASLLRAVLACHAHAPAELEDLHLSSEEKLHLCGYGLIDDSAVAASLGNDVTLWATDTIENDKVHFYEIPVPDDLLNRGKKRERQITIALSHFPVTRSTRLDYVATKISFHFVKGDLDLALRSFNAAVARGEVEGMSEYTNGRDITQTARSRGTLQMSRWTFTVGRKDVPKFVLVVNRHDLGWGQKLSKTREDYSIAVRISDRANERVNLYAKIRTMLSSRLRARVST